jgi:ATP-dependent DNA helicase RecG
VHGSPNCARPQLVPFGAAELADVLERILAGSVPADLETDQLDFKQQPDSKPDAIRALVDAAICFANARGGTIVMGISNRQAGSAAYTGCDLTASIVQRRVHELTDPPLMVGARTEEFASVSLLVVDVFQSFDIHADKQGRASQRIGTDCRPMSPQERDRLPPHVTSGAPTSSRGALGSRLVGETVEPALGRSIGSSAGCSP